MQTHAAGALHQRFDNDRGDALGLFRQERVESVAVLASSTGRSTMTCRGSKPASVP